MRFIRIFAKNMGDPYYEPTIVVHDIKEECQTANTACTNTLSKIILLKVSIQLTHLQVEGKC